ncbi:MAG: hypothetical protein KatS3mg102_1724 [Planctomycetota bacterium]|nr:MAG: hypothetical protein KatS3mg102_1724 [Planctomycetota bacterium]
MSGPRPSVLVAEDLSIVRRPLALILERRGYRVIEVTDGQAAIEALEREPIDAVLLDLAMPVIDGFGVLEHLRGRPDAPPVLVYTSHPIRGNVERALALGAHEVIVKGTHTIMEIAARLQAAIGRRTRAAGATSSPGGEHPEGR